MNYKPHHKGRLMEWTDYQNWFDFDGSWLDIYVLETTLADWQELIDALHSGIYFYEFGNEKDGGPLPLDAGKLFNRDNCSWLIVKASGVPFNCHFFT